MQSRGGERGKSNSTLGHQNYDLEERKSGPKSFSARLQYMNEGTTPMMPNALAQAIFAAGSGNQEEMQKYAALSHTGAHKKFTSHIDLLDQVSSRTQEMIHKHIANKIETASQNAINNIDLSSEEHDSIKHLNATSPPKMVADQYMSSLLPKNEPNPKNQTAQALSLFHSDRGNVTHSQEPSHRPAHLVNKVQENPPNQDHGSSTHLLALELQQMSGNQAVSTDPENMPNVNRQRANLLEAQRVQAMNEMAEAVKRQ